MKNLLLSFLLLGSFAASAQVASADNGNPLTFADLTETEKAEAITAMINGDCTYKGIKLYGKVMFVTSFPDIKIQYVDNFPDIKVKFVSNFPDDCGEWQTVDNFPDFKVQVVTSFPDIKVKKVDNFPGMN